jgi:hypothetical protein
LHRLGFRHLFDAPITILWDAVGIFIWCAESVEPPSGVTEVDLGESGICDSDLEYLKYFPKLRWLCLEDAPISDQGLYHLISLSSLRQLDLQGTMVSAEGVSALQNALPGCDIIW